MDITMCTGNCPISEHCLRYMAKPNPYGQSYSNLEDVCLPNGYSEFILYEENNIRKEYKNKSYTLSEFIFEQMNKQKISETN